MSSLSDRIKWRRENIVPGWFDAKGKWYVDKDLPEHLQKMPDRFKNVPHNIRNAAISNVTLGVGSSDITGTSTGATTAPTIFNTQYNAGAIANATPGDDLVVWCHPKYWIGQPSFTPQTLTFTGTSFPSVTLKERISRYTYNTTSWWKMGQQNMWQGYALNWNCDIPITISGLGFDICTWTFNWSVTGAAAIFNNTIHKSFTDASTTYCVVLGTALGTITMNNSFVYSVDSRHLILGLTASRARFVLNQTTVLCNTGNSFQNVVDFVTANNSASFCVTAGAGNNFANCVLNHCLGGIVATSTGTWKVSTYAAELANAYPDPTPKVSSQMANGAALAGGTGSGQPWATVVVNSLTTDIAGTAYGAQPAVGCKSATVPTDLAMAALITAMSVGDNIPAQLDMQEASWIADATYVGFPTSSSKAQGSTQFNFSGGLMIGWDVSLGFFGMAPSGGHVSFAGSNFYAIVESRHWSCLNPLATQPTYSGGSIFDYPADIPWKMHGYRDFATPTWTIGGTAKDVFIHYGFAPFNGAGSNMTGGYSVTGQMPVFNLNAGTHYSNASGQEGHEAIPNAAANTIWQTVDPGAMAVDPTNRAISYRIDILAGGATSQLIKATGTAAVDSRYAKIGATITNPTFFGTVADGPVSTIIKGWAGDGITYMVLASKTAGHEIGIVNCATAALEDLVSGARPLAASAAKTAMLAALDASPSAAMALYASLDGTKFYIGVGEENSGTKLGLWTIDCATKVVTGGAVDLSWAGGKTYPPHTCSTSAYLHRERRVFPNGEEALFTFANGMGPDSTAVAQGCLWVEKIAAAPAPPAPSTPTSGSAFSRGGFRPYSRSGGFQPFSR